MKKHYSHITTGDESFQAVVCVNNQAHNSREKGAHNESTKQTKSKANKPAVVEKENRGVATGVYIGIYTPKKKSAQVNFLWGKNDVRTAIQQFYTPKNLLYPKNKFLDTPLENKKAQLTQGLRATAPSFQHGGCSKTAVSRHFGYYRTGNSAIRSADPENPCLEPDMEWIECTVCEIFAFKLYCDLETGVWGHSRSLKVAP